MALVEIGNLIKNSDNFAIVSHTSPDGDSIGSMLGLFSALKEIGKSADMFIDDPLPEKYSFLPGYKEVKNIDDAKDSYSCLIALDCGDLDRLGTCKRLISKADIIINIDHHVSNSLFGTVNIVDDAASSVGEILYQLFKINDLVVSKDTSLCLYTSLLTDTGGFKYSNTTSVTLSIAGDLINTGIDFSEVYNQVFDVKSINQVKLMSRVTSTLETHFSGKIAILILSRDMLDDCNAREDDASDFINIARDIAGVEVAFFVKEVDSTKCRVSLRSRQFVDVRKIAEIFGGGGHIRASGCTISGSVQEVKDIIINELKKVIGVGC
jgi:bifunctional oligoribonuclease and PAP phosphatase NrnA